MDFPHSAIECACHPPKYPPSCYASLRYIALARAFYRFSTPPRVSAHLTKYTSQSHAFYRFCSSLRTFAHQPKCKPHIHVSYCLAKNLRTSFRPSTSRCLSLRFGRLPIIPYTQSHQLGNRFLNRSFCLIWTFLSTCFHPSMSRLRSHAACRSTSILRTWLPFWNEYKHHSHELCRLSTLHHRCLLPHA